MQTSLFLDTSPLGLLSQRTGLAQADECRRWLESCLARGLSGYVPEIADYELRRELLRIRNTAGVARLDAMKASLHYAPLTTEAMLLAASLWATSRQRGIVTADAKAMDGDVILAAQALTSGMPASEVVVVTSNVSHFSHLVPASLWMDIQP